MSRLVVAAKPVVDIIVRDDDAVVLLGGGGDSRLLRISEMANAAFHTVRDHAVRPKGAGMPLSDLVTTLIDRFGVPEEGDPSDAVRDLVDQLVDLDLLEWVDP